MEEVTDTDERDAAEMYDIYFFNRYKLAIVGHCSYIRGNHGIIKHFSIGSGNQLWGDKKKSALPQAALHNLQPHAPKCFTSYWLPNQTACHHIAMSQNYMILRGPKV